MKRDVTMNKYCEQCGAKLEVDELFCTECGAKSNVEEFEESTNIFSQHKTSNKQKKHIILKILLGLVAIILMFLIIGAIDSGGIKKGISDFKEGFQEGSRTSQESNKKKENTDTEETLKKQEDEKVEEGMKQEQVEDIPADYTQYIGRWINISGSVDEVYQYGGVLLEIISAENNMLTFSVTHVSNNAVYIAVADNITTTVKADRAEFTYDDSFGNTGEGTLLLKEDSIVAILSDTAPGEEARYSVATNVSLFKYDNSTSSDDVEPIYNISDYIFSDSDKSYLIENDLWVYSKEDLEIGRNEIFARRGRMFNDDRIRNYFESKSWYQGTIPPEEFDINMGSILNGYEKTNIQTIKNVETIKNQRGTP